VTIAESIAGSVGESLFLPGEAWRATNDSVQERALASLVASSPESIERLSSFTPSKPPRYCDRTNI
jgi:hypothetical protein